MPADFELPPSPGGLGTAYNDTITGGLGNGTIDGGEVLTLWSIAPVAPTLL